MKKRLFALLLVLAMLLSCTMMLTSCPDKGPDGPLNVDEGLDDGAGAGDPYILNDPTDPEAGAGAEDKYVGDHK